MGRINLLEKLFEREILWEALICLVMFSVTSFRAARWSCKVYSIAVLYGTSEVIPWGKSASGKPRKINLNKRCFFQVLQQKYHEDGDCLVNLLMWLWNTLNIQQILECPSCKHWFDAPKWIQHLLRDCSRVFFAAAREKREEGALGAAWDVAWCTQLQCHPYLYFTHLYTGWLRMGLKESRPNIQTILFEWCFFCRSEPHMFDAEKPGWYSSRCDVAATTHGWRSPSPHSLNPSCRM